MDPVSFTLLAGSILKFHALRRKRTDEPTINRENGVGVETGGEGGRGVWWRIAWPRTLLPNEELAARAISLLLENLCYE
jgi:hypothetical protein